MVLSLVDQHKPKCYLCHEGFDDIQKLREHQKAKHSDLEEINAGPAPGDVTMF